MLALYFAGDEAVGEYFSRISAGRAMGFVSHVNLAEFYYKTGQKLGADVAETRYNLVVNSRIARIPTTEDITKRAGKWKLTALGLSLADCFALASLESRAEVLLTTDSALKAAVKSKAVLFEV